MNPSEDKTVSCIDATRVCRDFMAGRCVRGDSCRFEHNTSICKRYWTNGSCKFKDNCRHKHVTNTRPVVKGDKSKGKGKAKNTVCFTPMTEPADMRIVLDLGFEKLTTSLTSRDVLLAPNIFSEFKSLQIYNQLVSEIQACNVPKDDLLKLWHGNDKIAGTHLIANDRTHWKEECPTFKMVVNKLAQFFNMDVKATRFNWYQDTSHWKPFHHDSAFVDPKKALQQNFTIAVSFGATRDAAFQRADTSQNVISIPQSDGHVYCFANDTNSLYRHGILQDNPTRNEGRISVILWGKVTQLD